MTIRYNLIRTFLVILASHIAIANYGQTANLTESETPENIILFIGDGMGLAQISSLVYSQSGKSIFEKFEALGFQKTHSKTDLVTDSAASATAMSCGVKTYNNAIGMDHDTLPVRNLMEIAKDKGKVTGIVVSSPLTHATPAAFYAHHRLRYEPEYIALDLLDGNIDFLIGGGKKYFDKRSTDKRDLVRELSLKGYEIADYMNEPLPFLNQIDVSKKFIYFTASNMPPSAMVGREYFPFACDLGIQYLNAKQKSGYFLMIEASQIDQQLHYNKSEEFMAEIRDAEKALKDIMSWVQRSKNTLLVVTADHETAGLSLNAPEDKSEKFTLKYTTNGHTAAMVPVFAYGPGSHLFNGIYDNTEIFEKLNSLIKRK